MRSSLPEKREEPRFRRAIRSKKRQQPLPLVGGNGKRKGTDTAARRTSRFVTPTKVRPLTGPSAQLPHSSERPQMKGLGDDHRGHAQGQPDEKHRQEPADPFLRISGVASPRKKFYQHRELPDVGSQEEGLGGNSRSSIPSSTRSRSSPSCPCPSPARPSPF